MRKFRNGFGVLEAKRVVLLHQLEQAVPFGRLSESGSGICINYDVAGRVFAKRLLNQPGFPNPVAAAPTILHERMCLDLIRQVSGSIKDNLVKNLDFTCLPTNPFERVSQGRISIGYENLFHHIPCFLSLR